MLQSNTLVPGVVFVPTSTPQTRPDPSWQSQADTSLQLAYPAINPVQTSINPTITIGNANELNGANCAFQNTVGRDLNQYQFTNISYAPPAHADSINQLPAQVEHFFGRVRMRQQLIEALAQQRPTVGIICNFYGMGGIGKTALAVWVAHAVADVYDGVLFIQMQHSSATEPCGLSMALQQAVRPFLGYHAWLPTDPEELSAVYRQMLHGRRFLVVLDDVGDLATLRAFTPPAGCALLTTSRDRLLIDTPANAWEVPTLQIQDAQALLLSRAPHLEHDPLLPTLLERCDYLPLAVRLVSTILAEQPSLTLARYLMRLESGLYRAAAFHHADQDVYDIVGRSDAQLARQNPGLATRWRMLHICPNEFPASVVATIWDEPDAHILEAQLAELRRSSLLRYDSATQRYRLPRLLRDIAQDRCNAIARTVAVERYAAFFQRVNGYAHDLIDTPAQTSYAMGVLQEVWPDLLGASEYLQRRKGMLIRGAESDLVGPAVLHAIRLHFNQNRATELMLNSPTSSSALHPARSAEELDRFADSDVVSLGRDGFDQG
jgi:hypothetical protein